MLSSTDSIVELGEQLSRILQEVETRWIGSSSNHFSRVSKFHVVICYMIDEMKNRSKSNLKHHIVGILLCLEKFNKLKKIELKKVVKCRPKSSFDEKERFKLLSIEALDLYDKFKLRFVVYCRQLIKYADDHTEDDIVPYKFEEVIEDVDSIKF